MLAFKEFKVKSFYKVSVMHIWLSTANVIRLRSAVEQPNGKGTCWKRSRKPVKNQNGDEVSFDIMHQWPWPAICVNI